MRRIKPRATQAAVAEVYDDTAGIVQGVAHRFAAKYNLDHDEMIAAANLAFLEAYHTFDASRGILETRIQHYVWHRLLDQYRTDKQLRRTHTLDRVDADLSEMTHDDEPHTLETIQRDLSPAACTVVRLMTDPTFQLRDQLERYRSNVKRARRCLGRYLIRSLKWGASQVADAFMEIHEALS